MCAVTHGIINTSAPHHSHQTRTLHVSGGDSGREEALYCTINHMPLTTLSTIISLMIAAMVAYKFARDTFEFELANQVQTCLFNL